MTKAKAKITGLRARAVAESSKFRVPKRESWLQQLARENPAEAAELEELIDQWKAGDTELRQAYPSGRALARFIESLEFVPVRYTTIRMHIEGRAL